MKRDYMVDFIQHCRKTGKDQKLGLTISATDRENARQVAERELNSIFIDKWTIVSIKEM